VLIYEWDAAPAAGVSDSRRRARQSAASALLATPGLASVVVCEARATLTIRGCVYIPTGNAWTGCRRGGRVAWTAARTPGELAS
jgi:hypothetical protein